MPIGNPFEFAYGTEIAGFPVRFAVTVLISTKNNETGSSIFSPILKGKIGTVGATSKSNFLNASLISLVSLLFTFNAFKKYLPA